MTTAAAPPSRRGSFLETWRLFAGAWRQAALLVLLVGGMMALMPGMWRGKRSFAVAAAPSQL